MANFCPIQFLGPAENGKYANGWRRVEVEVSEKNLSGIYFSGW